MTKSLTVAPGWGYTNTVDPGLSESGVSQFQSWLNTSSGNAFYCADATLGAQVWKQLGISGASIVTLNGNSGSATGSTVTVSGSGSLTTSGSSATLSLSLTGLTNHALLVGAGSATITKVGPSATSGQVLQSAGSSADPAFSTATYPATATGTGTILRADGTNWSATSATFPNTATQGDILYGSASNVFSSLAKNTTATRYLANTGTSNSPAWDQITLTNGVTGILPIANGGSNASSFTQSNGVVTYDGTRLVNYAGPQISSGGLQTNTSQTLFVAYYGGAATSVTGDGTAYTYVFGSTLVNQGTNYSTGTGIFTAPVTGRYLFSVTLNAINLGAAHTSGSWSLVTTGNTFLINNTNPYICSSGGSYTTSFSLIVPMTAADTAKVTMTISGSTKTVNVNNGGSGPIFSGKLVC